MNRLTRRFMKPDPRECEAVRGMMSDCVDGELAGDECGRVDDHVGICPACKRVLGNLRITLERVGLLAGDARDTGDKDSGAAAGLTQAWRARR